MVRTRSLLEGERAIDVRDDPVKVDTILPSRSPTCFEIGVHTGALQRDTASAPRETSRCGIEVALTIADAGVEVEGAGNPSAIVLLALGPQRSAPQSDIPRVCRKGHVLYGRYERLQRHGRRG